MAEYILEDEIEAARKALMGLENSQFSVFDDDPRNIDPDDDALAELSGAIYALEEVADSLREGLSKEIRRRHAIVDQMDDVEFAKWEKEIECLTH